MSDNPTNKPALDPKLLENGGDFSAVLQPVNQAEFVAVAAVPADLTAVGTTVTALRDALVDLGLMKAS